MGASIKTLSRLLELHVRDLLPSGASILDLGVPGDCAPEEAAGRLVEKLTEAPGRAVEPPKP
jgi:hypothetical protein